VRFSHLSNAADPGPRLAAVIGDGALFLDEVMARPPRDLQELIERGEDGLAEVRAVVAEAEAAGRELPAVHELRHASAVLRPPHVIAIGANYAAHASELKLRSEKAATVFNLWPNSLAGHGGTTTWPADLSTQVDYEAELGVVIGRPARNVSVQDALDYVWGYTVVNDITARDLQFSEAQWSRCKSFDGFTPNGPVVVTADEIPDPQVLDLWLTVNGEKKQGSNTRHMLFKVPFLISDISAGITLEPGDIIATGTPEGVGAGRKPQEWLWPGDVVVACVEGIGTLRHPVVAV
jgi:2-keto-4-pentenoate hydratase/2-oxohepta-3-ene-1,7-dioic acid hydratase in catechol pathway